MISLIKKLLEANNYLDIKPYIEESFLSHPNYPSLYAITDSLDLLTIENAAVKISKEQFVELPNAFLAVYNQDLVFVNKREEDVIIEDEKGKKRIISNVEFLSNWNEVVVLIEPNITPIIKKENQYFKKALSFIPVFLLAIVSFFFNDYNLSALFLLITSIIGSVIGVFILQEKLGIRNDIASKLCSINTNTSCDSVIKSDASGIYKWVDFSDLPLLFFSISATSILISPNNSSIVVGIVSILSIPIILYSVWLQKIVLKKWCVLCLIVSSILLIQATVFTLGTNPIENIFSANLFGLFFSSIVLSSLWFIIKPKLISKIKLENEVNDLKRFKRDYKLFQFSCEDIISTDGLNLLKGLHFGNRQADIHLTIIISPSCGHCHDAFKDAFELVNKYPEKFFLNVLFNINPENENNPYKIIVESLLEIQNVIPEKVEEAIVDWHINKIGLEKWLKKWKVEHVGMHVNNQIYQQYNWCSKNEFNYTPVKIINDKLFPKEYEINELKYFLNDFSPEVNETQILVQA